MSWTRERDLLIAQTMTFVQSITGKKLEAEARATETRIVVAPVDEIERADRPVEIVDEWWHRGAPRRSPEADCARKFRAGWRRSAPISSCSTASATNIAIPS